MMMQHDNNKSAPVGTRNKARTKHVCSPCRYVRRVVRAGLWCRSGISGSVRERVEQLSKREGELGEGEQTHLNSSSCLAISCISRTLACTDLWHVKGPPQYSVKRKGRYPPLRWQKLFLLNAPKVLLSSALGQYLPSLSLGSRMNSCYFRPKALLVSDPPLLMRPTPSSCGLCPWCTLSTCPEAQAN